MGSPQSQHIVFHEPSSPLEETSLAQMPPPWRKIYDKRRTVLRTAAGLRRSLTALQAECPHPMKYRVRDAAQRRHQCQLCGHVFPGG